MRLIAVAVLTLLSYPVVAEPLLCPDESAPVRSYEANGRVWGYKIRGALVSVEMTREIFQRNVVRTYVTCNYVIGSTYTAAGSCQMIQGKGIMKVETRVDEETECTLIQRAKTNDQSCMIVCDKK